MRTKEELESLIKSYAKTYYSDYSTVSDDYFDELVEELREVDPNSKILVTPGWGYEPEGKKEKHLYGEISGLPKIKKIEDIPEGYLPYRCRVSIKLDGLSAVSYYKNGKRFLSLTRGNGVEGKVITDKIDMISPETKELPNNFTGAVRGELVISQATWNKIKDQYKDNPSANQRNVASGIINRDYVNEETKYVDYVVYKVVADPENTIDSFRSMEGFLLYNNFKLVPEVYSTSRGMFTQRIFEEYYERFKQIYPCDGVVVTDYDICHEESGEIKYKEFAYKFKSDSEEVVVTDVTWSAGRTGRIVPRIWFTPVTLSGVQVQKCTGHNAAFIRDNQINKGTVIEVTRSGEVIPYMTKVVSNPNDKGLLPSTCPNCKAELTWKGDDLICENENEDQLVYRFISTAGSIDGAGWSLYSKVLETFDIKTFKDLVCFISDATKDYEVTQGEMVKNIIYNSISGKVTQQKCIKVVEKIIKGIYPSTFLVACNINGVSWNTAESLFKHYPEYFYDLYQEKVDYDKLYSINGFGYTTVQTLRRFEERLRDLVRVCTILEEKKTVEYQFSVAITGSLSMKRSDFDALLQSKGITQSSNFKEIKYLITNNPDSTSSKMQKAVSNGVEIISEEEFTKIFLK